LEGLQLIAGDVPRRLGPNGQVFELHKDQVGFDSHDHPHDIAQDPRRGCPAEAIARLEIRLKLGDTRRPLCCSALLSGLLPEGRLSPLALGRLFTLYEESSNSFAASCRSFFVSQLCFELVGGHDLGVCLQPKVG